MDFRICSNPSLYVDVHSTQFDQLSARYIDATQAYVCQRTYAVAQDRYDATPSAKVGACCGVCIVLA